MASITLESSRCPSDEASLTNRIFLNQNDVHADRIKYLALITDSGKFIFSIDNHPAVPTGKVGFSLAQRKWCNLSIGQKVDLQPYNFDPRASCIASASVEVDFMSKKSATIDPLNSDEMAREFGMMFCNTPLTKGQQIVFSWNKKLFMIVVKEIEGMTMTDKGEGKPIPLHVGLLMPNSNVVFEKNPESSINLVGKSKGKSTHQSIINPDWDFNKMGIGGLDKEFSQIFRRTFASRVFPPEVAEQLGLKHVRGILLFGPPGTGKTLMARQIGKMLNAREPKIVNGPSILDKYVGESEANIRKLFAEAEEENKRMGPNSALHIIIFDEIDAICKARGSQASGAAVHDTIVNQLLSKIDGVDQLNNILIIGMTNRRDMIDDALLRPGRLEVQMEISLPDEHGRLQILSIHAGKMQENGKLGSDVDLKELASKTKNFSGAEIEGLCRAAAFTAMYKLIKPNEKMKIDPDSFDKLVVMRDDFMHAIENDIKPAFGTQEEELDKYISRGMILWGEPVTHVLDHGQLACEASKESDADYKPPVALLLEGPRNSGKTALAVEIAKRSEFPFIKFVTSKNMIGYSEMAKCATIKKVFDDAYKSNLSCVILDNIEGLIDYSPVGPRYSNYVTQALRDLISNPLPKGKKMLLIATTSQKEALAELGLVQCFSAALVIHVGCLRTPIQVITALEEMDKFSSKEIKQITSSIQNKSFCVGIRELLDTVQIITKVQESHRVNMLLTRLQEVGAMSD